MSDKPLRFKSISNHPTSLFKDRGSKFLGYLFPVSSLQNIKEKILLVKQEHPKATHHCYAYRLGVDLLQFRANDDGEPSGSAGRPILGQIDSMGVTNILAIVVRYYGGTMLGVPGLINAYKTTTALAFDDATFVEQWVTAPLTISFDYNAMSEVLYHLRQSEAIIEQQDLQLFCTIRCHVPIVHIEQCQSQLSKIRGVQFL